MSIYFRHFVIISPWKKAGPFILTNLNPLHPRMLCAKLKLAQWFWRRWFFKFCYVKSLRKRHQLQWRTTDQFWSEKLTWAVGSGELKTTHIKGILLAAWILTHIKMRHLCHFFHKYSKKGVPGLHFRCRFKKNS